MSRYFNTLSLSNDFTADISLVYDEGRLRIVKGKYNSYGFNILNLSTIGDQLIFFGLNIFVCDIKKGIIFAL